MADIVEKEDNINSLCKKYFTPNLCDEPVTEGKAALKNKLLAQLLKYGDYIVKKEILNGRKYLDRDDFCLVIIDTIEACMEKWIKGINSASYSAYFFSAVKRNCINKLNTKEYKNVEYATRLDSQSYDDGERDASYSSNIEDDKESYNYAEKVENTMEAEKQLKFIDYCFRARPRDAWWKSILTGYFYKELHKFEFYSSNTNLARFNFIDMNVYNLTEAPTQNQIAEYLGKDKGQISRALNSFKTFVQEQYAENGAKL